MPLDIVDYLDHFTFNANSGVFISLVYSSRL